MHGRRVVTHMFGAQANDIGGRLVRTIGLVCTIDLVRTMAKIGMKNAAYNISQLDQLHR